MDKPTPKPAKGTPIVAPNVRSSPKVGAWHAREETATQERDAKTVSFEKEIVALFVDAADLLGVPKSVAMIYGICFASSRPLSFGDIRGRSALSQGSISQGLRVLREIGALSVVEHEPETLQSGPRSTRDYYRPNLELRKVVGRFVEDRVERQLQTGSERLRAISALVPNNNGSAMQELEDRLKALITWHEKGRALVPMVRAFLKLA